MRRRDRETRRETERDRKRTKKRNLISVKTVEQNERKEGK